MSLNLTFDEMREIAIRTLGGRPPSRKRGKFAKPKREKRTKAGKGESQRGRRLLDIYGNPITPIDLNPLDPMCERCIKECKQHSPCVVMFCPKYIKAGTKSDPNAEEFKAEKAKAEAKQKRVKAAKAAWKARRKR